MKRIARNPQKFDLLTIVDQYARENGLDILAQGDHEKTLEELGKQLEENRSNDILIHGQRIQAMFAFVAASLGKCRFIKEEDAGDLFFEDGEIQLPDFRIVTVENQKLMVEVKNCHEANLDYRFNFDRPYIEGLRRYAEIFETELYLAIYWSQPKLWSLLSSNDLELSNDQFGVALADAMMRNQMHLLGDNLIGTIPSLTLKLCSDPAKPRRVRDTGQVNFTIGSVELIAGEEPIENDQEIGIAWFLMNYGDWPGRELPPEIVDGELISLGFVVEPMERANPTERFETVGTLSTMISRQYNEVTAPEGRVRTLSPDRDPDTFGVVIPIDYKGTALPIWRFNVLPAAS